jgi:DNA-binding LacI/PurR family transcriptional regulator
MAKRPTIKDVASKAGVSAATVSFVLNKASGQPIGKTVRDRVQKAAQVLNYQPNASAAHLARRRTRHVAIAFYEEESLLSNTFYSRVIEGALKQALERNYHLLFSYLKTDYQGRNDLPSVITQRNTEGVLFIKRLVPEMVKDISAIGVPIVAIDHYPPSPLVGAVSMQNRRGGELAAEHLVELGHRRLAVIAGDVDRTSIADRSNGFLDALRRMGVLTNRRQALWQSASLTFAGGLAAATKGLRKDPQITGVFCVNDEMAAGVIRAAHQMGYRVPERLSVVGFDDIDMAPYLDPPLTTIGVDKLELGRRAMSQLIDLIESRGKAVCEERVGVQLVVRGSTGPRRKRAPTSP